MSEALLSVAMAGFPRLPNATRRMHWAQRADEARTWRGSAYLTALQALRENEWPADFPLRSATVELVVLRPDAHWPDDDNAIAAIKPVLDGMTDAKVWRDDRDIRGGISVRHETGPLGLRVNVLTGSAA